MTNPVTRFLPRRRDYAGLTHSWKSDVVAGLTVGVVALPLALVMPKPSARGSATTPTVSPATTSDFHECVRPA